jgi:16S rRNA (adenine1518-N6/adenine1519-N6)-dimethyltransferase
VTAASGSRRLLGRAEVVALLAEIGRHPARSLGQNFVVDPNTVTRIARLAGVGEGDRVVEVGAGLGSLSLALAATGASVLAIEIDAHLVPVLRRVVEPAGVQVLEADALSLDWSSTLLSAGARRHGGRPDARWVLVANLPYNVATPLVVKVLESAPQVDRLLVMVQKEVGERLAAGPGSRVYGAVSVKVAWFAAAAIVGAVSREVFLPRPNVDSVLVSIVRRPEPAGLPPYGDVMSLVRAGFAGRRKMLRVALRGVVSPDALVAAGIAPESRAEMLDVEAWGRLAQCQKSLAN